jgi:hypothetical protein
MRLKLREEPKEWQKFVAVLMVIPVVGTALMWRKGVWSDQLFYVATGVAVALILMALIWPRPFRAVYRVGMTISFYVGQAMGMVLLSIFFFLCVTPLALVLRVLGKDVLRLKRSKGESYWQPAKSSTRFDRQF